MSFVTMSRAKDVRGITPMQRLVLYRLADMANDEGHCFPLLRTLASEFECSERHVRAAVAALEKVGAVYRRAGRHKVRGRAVGPQCQNDLWVCPSDDRRACEGLGGGYADSLDLVFEEALARKDSSGCARKDSSALGRKDSSALGRKDSSSPAEPSKNNKKNKGGFPFDPSSLTPFQRAEVLAGRSVLVAGSLIRPDGPEGLALARAVRSAFA